MLKNKGISQANNNQKQITASQIRDRIRKNKILFNANGTKPITYTLKNNEANLWTLKTVEDSKKASQTDSYKDSLTEFYNYDSYVPNYKRIAEGDVAYLFTRSRF